MLFSGDKPDEATVLVAKQPGSSRYHQTAKRVPSLTPQVDYSGHDDWSSPNDFASLGQFSATLLAFVRRCNKTAKPFNWTYPAADLTDLPTPARRAVAGRIGTVRTARGHATVYYRDPDHRDFGVLAPITSRSLAFAAPEPPNVSQVSRPGSARKALGRARLT